MFHLQEVEATGFTALLEGRRRCTVSRAKPAPKVGDYLAINELGNDGAATGRSLLFTVTDWMGGEVLFPGRGTDGAEVGAGAEAEVEAGAEVTAGVVLLSLAPCMAMTNQEFLECEVYGGEAEMALDW